MFGLIRKTKVVALENRIKELESEIQEREMECENWDVQYRELQELAANQHIEIEDNKRSIKKLRKTVGLLRAKMNLRN